MRITDERWAEAQEAERACHDRFLEKAGEEGVRTHYSQTYAYYFKFLGIEQDQTHRTIVEIGCADFPAIEYCFGNSDSYLIEPLPSEILKRFVDGRPDIHLIQEKAEDVDIPECDELWLLNVLQHVQDPDKFIENCKKAAKVIRFFEPIDWPIEIYHPHTFGFGDFVSWFGDCVQRYEGTQKDFHTANCAYGVWKS